MWGCGTSVRTRPLVGRLVVKVVHVHVEMDELNTKMNEIVNIDAF